MQKQLLRQSGVAAKSPQITATPVTLRQHCGDSELRHPRHAGSTPDARLVRWLSEQADVLFSSKQEHADV